MTTTDNMKSISATQVTSFLFNPLLFEFYKQFPHYKKQTDPMLKGTLIHLALLEPDKLDKQFYFIPGSTTTKEVKELIAIEQGGMNRQILRQTHIDFLKALEDSLSLSGGREAIWSYICDKLSIEMNKSFIEKRLNGVFEIEEDDGKIQFPITGKPDLFFYNSDRCVIVDLKTSGKKDFMPGNDKFLPKLISDNYYGIQLAFYGKLIEQHFNLSNRNRMEYYILFVENKAPHDLRLIKIHNDIIERSESQLMITMQHFGRYLAGIASTPSFSTLFEENILNCAISDTFSGDDNE